MRKIIRNAVLASIASMMVVGGNVFAASTNMDVSPVDKGSSKDSAGMIYDATYNGSQKGQHFWTDLGHYEIKDANGNKVSDLYTPFFYHTSTDEWDPTSGSYNPVHKGDGSEMLCKESMSKITVGEMDRVIKALYQNDLSVYQAINGSMDDSGQVTEGIKQKLFTSIESKDLGNGKTQYDYKSESGKTIGTTYDTNTKNKSLTIGQGPNSGVRVTLTDTDGNTLVADTDYIASKAHVEAVSSRLMEETKSRMSEDNRIEGNQLKEIKASVSGNKTTYSYITNNGKEIGTTYDYDTKLNQVGMIFTDTKDSSILTWTGVDNTGEVLQTRIDGIASRKYVDDKVKEINNTIGGMTDTNTKNSRIETTFDDAGNLGISVIDTDGNTVSGTVTGVATKKDITDVKSSIENIDNRVTNNTNEINNIKGDITDINNRLDNLTDNDTVSTVTTGDDWLHNEVTETENGFDNKLTFNEDKLKDYIKDNSQDTITTVSGSGLAKVTESKTDSGYHYVIDVDADVVKDIAKSVDTNTTNKSMESTRDSENGTATISVVDSDNNVVSTTIEDVASHKELKDYKESNDRDKEVMREVINNNSERITGLESKVNSLNENVKEVGAHAAALAALHPLDYDEDDKLTFAAGMGNYRGKNAAAIGAFYRPNEDTMFSIGGSFGSGDGMVNLGVSLKLGPTPTNRKSKKELIEELDDLKAQVAALHEAVEAIVNK